MKFLKSCKRGGVIGFIALSLTLSVAYAPINQTSIPKAHAQLAVYDPANHIVNILTAGATTGSTLIMQTLNGLAWTAAKLVIQTMTKSIVNWINSGYQGSPAFVTNLESTLSTVANSAADSFIKQLAQNGSIKSPFQSKIANAIRSTYNKKANGGFFTANPYTLNKVSSDPAAFLKGDFNKGGFNAWFSAISNPQNNPYGAAMLATNALDSQVAGAVTTRSTELGWSKGFLSWRGKCAVTSGKGGGAVGLNNSLPVFDAKGNGTMTANTAAPATNLSTNDNCLSYDIQTPGSVVESQLENTLGSPIRQLELTNSINEIIGAAVTQMATQVLGSTGLFGLSQKSSSGSGGTSPLDRATDPAAYSGNTASLAQGFTQNLTNQKTQISQFQTNWQTIQTAAQSAKAALQTSPCVNTPANMAAVQQVIVQSTAALATADSAVTALAKIQDEVTAAQKASASNQPAAIQAASSEYQSFLASGKIPSTADISFAVAQSSDTGSSTPPSLYTQMMQIVKGAQSCVVGH